VEALKAGKIECRVYRKDRFHAKTYIARARQEVIGAFALVGSSNLTYPGLTNNVELNVQIAGRQVRALQEWYDKHWEAAEDVTPEILDTVERHVREYQPFDVYAKSLDELFRGYALTGAEWEEGGPDNGGSRVWPILDGYQQKGYRDLLQIARRHNGAFLCDAVGLGKTYVGLMLIERLVMYDRKRVVLLVPKSTREDVWERELRARLGHVGGFSGGDFSNLAIFNHTDLNREGEFPARFERIKELADVFIIDEAHHFRNRGTKGTTLRGPSRYWRLYDLLDGPGGTKQLFMLTATPVNNSLDDFRHMVELFTREQDDYFRRIGINSLRGHFVSMKRRLDAIAAAQGEDAALAETNMAEAEQVLEGDKLFRELVEQRSRAYVRESQLQAGEPLTSFPTRQSPRVAEYSVKKTYGQLLKMVEEAFRKEEPLFVLSIYYPLGYYTGQDETVDPFVENRQKQVVGLIRTQFLKRFESSAHAFMASCDRLLLKLLAWATRHSESESEKRRLQTWKSQNAELIGYVQNRQLQLWGDGDSEADEDLITPEMLESVEELSRDEYEVGEILSDVLLDLGEIAKFLGELREFDPRKDDKLQALIKLLRRDTDLRAEKVLIFTEFADTARYLRRELQAAGIDGVAQIDGDTKPGARSAIIRRFAPYYNGSSSADLADRGEKEIRVLISTDVLSEGLNLQDACRLINYDLHWNPVRLMQRIGRVDRRMNPDTEERMLADHPERADTRGNIVYWNFLPPDELEDLLRLYSRVSHKTLRISKTFGIEGKQLLTPDDDYDALRHFDQAYEGSTTPMEELHLEYDRILRENQELDDRIQALPRRVFSGKEHPSEAARGVFFCYRLPGLDHERKDDAGDPQWTDEAGETRWYLYDLATEAILDDPSEIAAFIRCEPDTPRRCAIERPTLVDIRKKLDKHVTNTYLKSVQAPAGVKATLKAWMELN